MLWFVTTSFSVLVVLLIVELYRDYHKPPEVSQRLQCWENWWRARRCLGSSNHHVLRLCGMSASTVPSHKANLHGWWPWNLISVHNAYPRDAHAFSSGVIQKIVQLLFQRPDSPYPILCAAFVSIHRDVFSNQITQPSLLRAIRSKCVDDRKTQV